MLFSISLVGGSTGKEKSFHTEGVLLFKFGDVSATKSNFTNFAKKTFFFLNLAATPLVIIHSILFINLRHR